MTRIDRTINSIVGLAEGLNTKLVNARAVLLEQRSRLDGWTGSSDAPKVSHTAELTPTEAAAHQRIQLDTRWKAIEDELNAAVLILRNLHQDCDRIIGNRAETPRCTATGRDGAIEWGDPTCWRVPTRGPLCDKCAKAEYRWRRDHGLPPRTDGVFSAA